MPGPTRGGRWPPAPVSTAKRDLAQDLEAVLSGQHHVENDEIVTAVRSEATAPTPD
jgi:hypothetical protein